MRSYIIISSTATLLSSLALVGCGGASDPGDPTAIGSTESALSAGCAELEKKDKPVFWSGTVGPEDAPRGGEPPECASVNCDKFKLRIDLPNGTFNNPNKPGGVIIGIRFFNANNTLNLFVYKGSQLVGQSAGIIATAEGVFLSEPKNGEYTIWIAADPTYNLDPSVPYEAYARVEYNAKTKPVTQTLPDLEFRAPRNLKFEHPSFPLFEDDPPANATCFNTEVEQDGAVKCLRFDQVIANIGNGALEVREAIPKDPANTALNAFQRVYNSDGTFTMRPAGDFEYHAAHHHYHYKSLAQSFLWQSNNAGAKLGTVPIAKTLKRSFCIADIEIDRWGKDNVGPRTYFAPDCLMPLASDANFDYLIVGMTHGWGDVYDWFLPGQYIETKNVANGFYILESCADPDSRLLEANETNNCIKTLIQLSNMSATFPTVTSIRVVP
jgi:hypothetical protein